MANCKCDGWHNVGPYKVYVENRVIIRGMKKDENGHWVPAYTYRSRKDFPGSRQYYWSRENMTPAALRAGLARGTCTMA